MIIPQVDTLLWPDVDVEVNEYMVSGKCISDSAVRTIVSWFDAFSPVFGKAFKGEYVNRYEFIEDCYSIARAFPDNLDRMFALNYWVIKSGQN